MNFMKILLVVFGTVALSVSTTILTVKLLLPGNISHSESASMSPPNIPIHDRNFGSRPSTGPAPEVLPLPMPQRAPNSFTPTITDENGQSLNLDFYQTPEIFDTNYDDRKPLSVASARDYLKERASECLVDFEKLCLNKQFYIERPLTCLQSHKDKLAKACYTQVEEINKDYHNSCSSDIQRFCKPQTYFHKCLKDNLNSVSKRCKAKVMSFNRPHK